MSPATDSLEQQLADSGLSELIERLPDLDDIDAVNDQLDALVEIARRRVLSDPAVAKDIMDACEAVAPRFQRPDIGPQVDYIRARIQLIEGSTESALELIQKSRTGWLEIGRPLDALRTDLGRMNVLDDLGRHDDAAAVGERLLTGLNGVEADGMAAAEMVGWLRAAAQENLGAAYGYTGRHQRAISAYEQAESTYRDLGDTSDVARCRANRGVERVAMGHAMAGHRDVLEAAEAFRSLGDQHSYAKCLGHLADAELLLGAYTDCLDHIAEARNVLNRLEANAEAARLAVKACRSYLSLNLHAEAIDIGGRAEQTLLEQGLRHDLAEIRLLMAVAYRSIGDLDSARQKVDDAVTGAVASDDPALRIRALTTRSRILADQGNAADARKAAADALDAALGGPWPAEEVAARLQVCRLAGSGEVAEHLERAATLAGQLGLPQLEYGVLLEQGRQARNDGRPADARHCFERAIRIVEGLRGHIGDASARTAFLEGRTAGHDELLASVLHDGDGDPVEAFELAERSKARTLVDLMVTTTDAATASDGHEATTIEIEADLDACYRSLLTGTGTDRRLLQERTEELETLLRRVRFESDRNGATALDRSESFTEPALPSHDEQVVEYHVSGGRLIAFVWSHGDLHVVTDLPSLSETGQLVDAWVRQCERFELAATLPGRPTAQLVDSANASLAQIWHAVFAPVAAKLVSSGALLVVPHGPLHAVPFHALPGPDGPMGDTWTVGLAPSYAAASVLRNRGRAAGRALVVGVADEAAPAVTTEARAVAAALGDAELLLDDAATVEGFRRAARQPAGLIHIACHGLHRSQNPMFSALRLADGWLAAHDVLAMRLPGSLVVLSACESGRHGGEKLLVEPLGLPRSFLAAGARAVVVSLWRTDDAVAAEVMASFYDHLKQDVSPAEALQRAQQDIVADHPHPTAWAPFAIHGGLPEKGRS
jgi:CHAT domain-containing protein